MLVAKSSRTQSIIEMPPWYKPVFSAEVKDCQQKPLRSSYYQHLVLSNYLELLSPKKKSRGRDGGRKIANEYTSENGAHLKPQSLIKHCHCSPFSHLNDSYCAPVAWKEVLSTLFLKNGSRIFPLRLAVDVFSHELADWLEGSVVSCDSFLFVSVLYTCRLSIHINEFLRESNLRESVCRLHITMNVTCVHFCCCLWCYIFRR